MAFNYSVCIISIIQRLFIYECNTLQNTPKLKSTQRVRRHQAISASIIKKKIFGLITTEINHDILNTIKMILNIIKKFVWQRL